MAIRRVRPTDRSEWLRMREALWPGRRDDHARDIDDYFDHRHNHMAVLVAERSDGNLGGFVEVSIRDYAEGCETRNVGYIEGWYVDPDTRRQAIGRA
jgi:aminoglycoside 6'-N-acetyltransferase I